MRLLCQMLVRTSVEVIGRREHGRHVLAARAGRTLWHLALHRRDLLPNGPPPATVLPSAPVAASEASLPNAWPSQRLKRYNTQHERRHSMRVFTAKRLASCVVAFAATASFSAHAADQILASVPGLTFPFFVHMMKAYKAEAQKRGLEVIESDGQVSSPKQTADIEAALTKGVKGIVISPNEVDALAPALQQAVDAKVPVVTVDRRVAKVDGILAHVGADNVKGGEAQGELIVKMFPNGATIINLQGQSGASPAIDRNKGLHNVLDKAKDKYKIVFEQTAGFDRAKGLSV